MSDPVIEMKRAADLVQVRAAMAAFGKAYRDNGETHPITVKMWQNAINAQAFYRKVSAE